MHIMHMESRYIPMLPPCYLHVIPLTLHMAVHAVRPGKDPAEEQSAGGKTHRARGLGDVGLDLPPIDICMSMNKYMYI